MDSTQRVIWIVHDGARILKVDLRSTVREEQLSSLEAFAGALAQSPDEKVDVLVLGDAGMDYFPDVSTRTKALMAGLENKIRRSVLLGFSGITRVAFDGFFNTARLMGQDVEERGRHYEAQDMDSALQWLSTGALKA